MEESVYILKILKEGKKEGLQLLFRKYYRPLVLYASKYVQNQDEAEDVVQDVFIKLWEKDSFASIESHLCSYLYQSVRNQCINLLKSRDRRHTIPIDPHLELSEDERLDDAEWNQRVEDIYQEIQKLSPRTQQILIAILFQNKKYKEVAEEMDISINTVKTTLSRAMMTLRNRLSDKTYFLLALLYTFYNKYI